jgi:hypothetical protein
MLIEIFCWWGLAGYCLLSLSNFLLIMGKGTPIKFALTIRRYIPTHHSFILRMVILLSKCLIIVPVVGFWIIFIILIRVVKHFLRLTITILTVFRLFHLISRILWASEDQFLLAMGEITFFKGAFAVAFVPFAEDCLIILWFCIWIYY